MSSPCENCGRDVRTCVDCDFYKGFYVKIPANPTNGSVMCSVFDVDIVSTQIDTICTDLDGSTLFHQAWWNAPYKGGQIDDRCRS